MERRKVIIMGAAGRDFHNFNVFFRDNRNFEVVAFTATQIPGIECRTYPPELSGKLYPNGVPVRPEEELAELVKKHGVDEVILAYSDLTYDLVMHKASVVLASGADFRLMGPKSTCLKSKVPVIGICAVRTGAGKSTATRRIARILRNRGIELVAVRHPMPYDPNIASQAVQRFATLEDMDKARCTIEEREEYEPHISAGTIVYAGVDYERILRQAEKEAQVILWDGGNNDMSFYVPDLLITVADALRPGQEVGAYPGEANVIMSDVVVINKVDVAKKEDVELIKSNIKKVNPKAEIIEAKSAIKIDRPELVKGKSVLVIEDGPTVTHGQTPYGAGTVAAKQMKAKIIDPHPYAAGSIKDTFNKYKQVGALLPTMGYSPEQIKDLEKTIKATPCDTVLSATPIDLNRIMKIDKPLAKVSYELEEITKPNLDDVVSNFLKKIKL
ncbi:MAG: cyclic 2,3-diphosphoglycerate synthase [Candidatus Atabeyarchaeum deiterrae]